jgi:hypothetical protein
MMPTRLALSVCLPMIFICGCSSGKNASSVPNDLASAPDDLLLPAPDLMTFDLTPPCTPQTLLDGSSVPATQGWSTLGDANGMVSSDEIVITFKTEGVPAPAQTSADLLYRKDIGLSDATGYALEWRLKVVTSDGHNQFDAPVAFLASASSAAPTPSQRSQMIYFDVGAIGWADDAEGYAVDTTNVFHVYRLDVTPTGHAEVRVDGTLALTRENFTTDGAIAIGDQTNDPNVDSQFSVASIRRLCL